MKNIHTQGSKTFLFILLLIVSIKTTAQETAEKKGSWKAGMEFLTNNVYLGRVDTIPTSVFTPSLGYTFGFGLFLNATAEYIPNRTVNKLDGGNFQVGYNFNFTDNFEGSISFTKLFYAATSTQISSSISSTTSLSLDYNIDDIITPTLNFDYNVGKEKAKNDYLLNPTITHDFLITGIGGEKNFILITPTAGLNAGTQNFYDSYFKNKKGKKNKLYDERLNAYRVTLSNFTLLDYEFSVPISYSLKPFLFTVTPTVALPENKLPKAITVSQVNQSALFYGDFAVSVKF